MTSQLYIDTLTTSQIKEIEQRMRPGEFSNTGFLKSGENLKDLIYRDAATLRRLGATHEQVADTLEYLITIPTPPKGFSRASEGSSGWQRCPFEKPQERQKIREIPPYSGEDFYIFSGNTGYPILKFGGLLIHLIRKHQFFEGEGTEYRLDPEQAVKVLQIKPHVGAAYVPSEWRKRVENELGIKGIANGGDALNKIRGDSAWPGWIPWPGA